MRNGHFGRLAPAAAAEPVLGPYRAPPWLPGGHAQTIGPVLAPRRRVPLQRERWTTPDGDFIDVDWGGSHGARRLLVLFHGLEGGAASHYVPRLARAALARGWAFALPHFRGCSGEPNRLARAYHSGDSDEAHWLLERLRARCERLAAAGVSLGGNVLLKWLGERGEAAQRTVVRAAAISAPFDLEAAGRALARGFNRLVYARHFLATLKPKAIAKARRFPGLIDAARVGRARTLREFDDAVTAPLHGFRDALDYWRRASAAQLLGAIRVPTLLLNARNDPFFPEATLVRAAAGASPWVERDFPATGGHAGFPGCGDWLARRVLDFLDRP